MQQLMSTMRAAIEKYGMITNGDRIAVGVSGGKDSVALLCALAEMRRFYPARFDIIAITLDPCFEGVPGEYSQINELCHRLRLKYFVKRTNLWEIIFKIRKESNPCSLCARMRRGALHDQAKALGCNKLALGHHMDDAIETFYMNLFNGGNLGSFQPVTWLSRKELSLIRPMVFSLEKDIVNVVNKYNLPIVKSKCPADGCTERENMKNFIKQMSVKYPQIKEKTLGALERAGICGW